MFFSGLIEGFGEFCNKHGLEMVTSDSLDDKNAMTEAENATNNNISATRALSEEAESLRIINLMSGTCHMIQTLPFTLKAKPSIVFCVVPFRHYPWSKANRYRNIPD